MNQTTRPWPVPPTQWSMRMVWHDLLFLHWPVPTAALRPLIPGSLEIDTFEGQAWIAVVPFHMSGIRHRWLPPMPGLAAFPELNVRTYVRARGRSGVYFFSLDAHNAIAVQTARAAFRLNYLWAGMHTRRDGDWVEYASRRTHFAAPRAEFRARYRPTGPRYSSRSGDLDHWLTERYALFVTDRGGAPLIGEIDHSPWPLQPAEVLIEANTMAHAAGIALPDSPPLAHFAERLDVVAWSLA